MAGRPRVSEMVFHVLRVCSFAPFRAFGELQRAKVTYAIREISHQIINVQGPGLQLIIEPSASVRLTMHDVEQARRGRGGGPGALEKQTIW